MLRLTRILLSLTFMMTWFLLTQLPTHLLLAEPRPVVQAVTASGEPPQAKPSVPVQQLFDESNSLLSAHDVEGALSAIGRALMLARQTDDRVGEVWAHRGRALRLYDLKHMEEATAEWLAAAQGWEALGDGPGRIEALVHAGQLLLLAKKEGESAALLDQAESLTRSEQVRPWAAANTLASSLDDIGSIAAEQGDRRAAAKYYGEALAIRERLEPESLNVAKSLHSLAVILLEQGDPKAAAAYLLKAMAIKERLVPDSLSLAATLHELGLAMGDQGNLKTEAEYHRRALTIQTKAAPESLDVAESMHALGIVAEKQGDSTASSEYFRLALAIKEKLLPDSITVARTLNELAIATEELGDLKGAADYYRRALSIKEKLMPNSRTVAVTLIDLAHLMEAKRDSSAAVEYLRRALAIEQKEAPDSQRVAAIFNGLGHVSLDRGDNAGATAYFQQALKIQEITAGESLDTANSLGGLAFAAGGAGDLETAEYWAHRAWDIVRHQGELIIADQARQAFGSAWNAAEGLLLYVQIARQEPAAALVTLEEGRASALARLLFERREVLSRAVGNLWLQHQETLAKLYQAEVALRRAENIPVRSNDTQKEIDSARVAYQEARNQADEFWAQVQSPKPRPFAPNLNPAENIKALSTDDVFVEYWLRAGQAYVFASGGGDRVKVLGEEIRVTPTDHGRISVAPRKNVEGLSRRVLDFWELCRSPNPSSASKGSQTKESERVAEGRQLFDALFPGEIGNMVRKAKRLVVSPDGPLWQLPFAALVVDVDTSGTPHYLGEKVAITYAHSLALYAQSKQEAPRLRKGGRLRALVVGDPNFDREVEPNPKNAEASPLWAGLQAPGSRPDRLRSTGPEARVVARIYGSDWLTKDNATEAEVRKRIETADVIHMATHGVLQAANPMSSAVLLTPPLKGSRIDGTNNDGALQAWEIFSELKLRAELVVLSACETARGDIVQGEGVVGLARALEYAGAHSVVATQWSVETGTSTVELMQEFHKRLRRGEAKDKALRQAMTTVRKKYSHPFYWAPFILMGNPDNGNLGTP